MLAILADIPLVVIMTIVFGIIFIAVIFNISKKMGPQYHNALPNGIPFGKDTIKNFKEKRIRNNPLNESVGLGTDRCHFCGHKRETEKRTPFTQTLLEKDRKTCIECHLHVDYF